MTDVPRARRGSAGGGVAATRAFLLVALPCLVALLVSACSSGGGSDGVGVSFTLDPAFPEVGTAGITVRLVDEADAAPLGGGTVSLEANMNHAGMTPTFADLVEAEGRPGEYRGRVEFTMGGDWFLLLEAKLPDGRVVQRQLDVPGVRSK